MATILSGVDIEYFYKVLLDSPALPNKKYSSLRKMLLVCYWNPNKDRKIDHGHQGTMQ